MFKFKDDMFKDDMFKDDMFKDDIFQLFREHIVVMCQEWMEGNYEIELKEL